MLVYWWQVRALSMGNEQERDFCMTRFCMKSPAPVRVVAVVYTLRMKKKGSGSRDERKTCRTARQSSFGHWS